MNYKLHSLYQEHHLRLFRVVMKIVKDAELSKDIVHDTFVEAGMNYHSLRDESKIVGWIYKIAVNQAISIVRTKKRITLVPLEILEIKKYADINDPLKHLTDKELNAEIRASLDILDSTSLAIVTLFYYEEQSIKQIGEILQLPTGTVKSRLNRAKRKLRNHILKYNLSDFNYLTGEGGAKCPIDSKSAYAMPLSKK
jgi:RNA polymerase sigma-70 factor (ECF subfamily)